MRVKLNAFHKDFPSSYSKFVDVSSYSEFLKVCAEFEAEVPINRFYTEHENVSGEAIVDQWIEDEDNGVKPTLPLNAHAQTSEEKATTGLDNLRSKCYLRCCK